MHQAHKGLSLRRWLGALLWVGAALTLAGVGLVQGAQNSPETKQAKQDAAGGRALFVKYGCYECHGLQAQGGVGPHLGPNPLASPAFIAYVRHPAGSMPPYTQKVLSDEDLSTIYTFLKSLPAPEKANAIPLLNQ